MCLGTPLQIIELPADLPELATVVRDGARQSINIGLLDPGSLTVGDWVLAHLGFAMRRMEPDEAEAALAYREENADAMVSWGAALGGPDRVAPRDVAAQP